MEGSKHAVLIGVFHFYVSSHLPNPHGTSAMLHRQKLWQRFFSSGAMEQSSNGRPTISKAVSLTTSEFVGVLKTDVLSQPLQLVSGGVVVKVLKFVSDLVKI